MSPAGWDRFQHDPTADVRVLTVYGPRDER